MRHPRLNPMQGLSLIELMVSMVIGLVLMISIVSAYLGSSGASRVAEAQARMNDDAQAALTVLTQQLRMAGNNPKQLNYTAAAPRNPVYSTTATMAVRGCDGTFSDVTTATDIPSLTCAGGATPHSIAVSYEADRFNTVPTAVGGTPTDCLGQSLTVINTTTAVWDGAAAVPTNVTYTVADNRLYIGNATVSGVVTPSLFCKGNGNATPQPLVENIEDLRFQYGTAPIAATSSLTVVGYLTGDAVDALGLGTTAERWSKVVTVRICVLVRSEQEVVADAASARYTPCFPTATEISNGVAAPDLRMRRAYTTTVVLRNRIETP